MVVVSQVGKSARGDKAAGRGYALSVNFLSEIGVVSNMIKREENRLHSIPTQGYTCVLREII